MPSRPDNIIAFWKIICLAFLISAAFQGSRGLYETTEGRYAECAREMLVSGHFLEPTLDFRPHWTKPPMAYWAIASGIAVFGPNAWGARVYQVLTFCLTVAAVWLLAMLMWDDSAASYAALVYATSPFPAGAAGVLAPDNLLTLWEVLAMLGFWAGVRLCKQRYFSLMWLALGAAFLTKGPPGLIPILSILPVYWLLKRKTPRLPSVFSATGIILFVVVGLGWYLYEAALNPGLLEYWIKGEVVNRITTDQFHRNPEWYKAIVIYWPLLALGGLPWVGLIVWKRKDLLWPKENWFNRGYWRERSEALFVLLSLILPLGAFSLSKSKLPLYVLPLFIPVALSFGKWLHYLVLNGKIEKRTIGRIALATVVVIVAIKGGLAYRPSEKDMGRLAFKLLALGSATQRRVYVVDDEPMYGLEFYLEGRLTRVTLNSPSSHFPPILSISDLPRMIEEDRVHGATPVILVSTERLEIVEKTLRALGMSRRQPYAKSLSRRPAYTEDRGSYGVEQLDDHRVLITV